MGEFHLALELFDAQHATRNVVALWMEGMDLVRWVLAANSQRALGHMVVSFGDCAECLFGEVAEWMQGEGQSMPPLSAGKTLSFSSGLAGEKGELCPPRWKPVIWEYDEDAFR